MITFLVKRDHRYTLEALGTDFSDPLPRHAELLIKAGGEAPLISATNGLFVAGPTSNDILVGK